MEAVFHFAAAAARGQDCHAVERVGTCITVIGRGVDEDVIEHGAVAFLHLGKAFDVLSPGFH